MHRTIKIGAKVGALAAVALIASATAANAATYNADGTGFIGKGEVQSAFAMKNTDLQKAVDPGKGFSFRTEQGASQSLTQALEQHATQDGTQSGTQSGTQVVSQSATQEVIETLSCTKTNGNIDQRYRIGARDGGRSDTRTAERTAERDAHRDGTRDGVRYGTRAGSLAGTLNASIDAKARKTGQWTGWNVTGYLGNPTYTATGTPAVFPVVDSLTGDYEYGDWSFAGSAWEGTSDWGNFGEYDLGAYDWAPATFPSEDFIAAPGNNDPDGVCKEGASNVVPGSVSLVTTYGDPVDGDVEFDDVVDGDVTPSDVIVPGEVHDDVVVPGEITDGVWSASGPIKTFATNLNTMVERLIG